MVTQKQVKTCPDCYVFKVEWLASSYPKPDIEICGQDFTLIPSKTVRVLLNIGGLRFYT